MSQRLPEQPRRRAVQGAARDAPRCRPLCHMRGRPTRWAACLSAPTCELTATTVDGRPHSRAEITKDSTKHVDDSLLQDYMTKWALFTQSIPQVDFIFRYLNKNWIPRAIDEGKSHVFHIEAVHSWLRSVCLRAWGRAR